MNEENEAAEGAHKRARSPRDSEAADHAAFLRRLGSALNNEKRWKQLLRLVKRGRIGRR